ncbi:hypothetical protein QQF64_023545 [Cirrhinus molitorella]|uniref:G2/M phase-specific E3 ubiquitin-protein ligase-like n=1 Tax=Cirrhinus molitorella TaxID=172907 RepID=A0ABR3NIM7_9TELE
MGCGNKLITPKLSEGQELDGRLILKVFKLKALYVKPSRPLLLAATDSSDDSCFEVDMPHQRVYQSSGPASEENTAIDLNEGPPPELNPPQELNSSPVSSALSLLPVPTVHSLPPVPLALSPPPEFHLPQELNSPPVPLALSAPPEFNPPQELNSPPVPSVLSLLPVPTVHSLPPVPLALSPPPEFHLPQELSPPLVPSALSPPPEFHLPQELSPPPEFHLPQELNSPPVPSVCTPLPVASLAQDITYQPIVGTMTSPSDLLPVMVIMILTFPSYWQANDQTRTRPIREDRYFIAGRAVAVSLVHGEPAPGCFSKTLFDSLVQGPDMCIPVLDNVADCKLYNKIKKVSEATTLQELQDTTDPIVDYLANAGCLRPLRSIVDRDRLVEDLLKFQVVNRVRGPFERFRDGLKTLGVFSKVQQHPEAFRSVFCHQPNQLTTDIMDDLFEIQWSENGSNRRANENRVIAFWRDYLQDVEEEGSQGLEAILAFATADIPSLPEVLGVSRILIVAP